MSTSEKNTTLTAAEIADLAGVGRSAVSNWRSRGLGFPEPIAGTFASPRFDLSEIRSWFEQNGRPFREPSLGQGVWSVLDHLRGAGRVQDAVEMASALIICRHVADEGSPGYLGHELGPTWRTLPFGDLNRDAVQKLIDAIQDLDPDLGEALVLGRGVDDRYLADLISAINAVAPTTMPALFEEIQDAAQRAERGMSEHRSSRPLVELLTAVSASVPGAVFDPAVGTGELLLAAARSGQGRVGAAGVEVVESVWRTAVQRLRVHGVTATIRRGDSLVDMTADRAGAGVVLVDPPYGMRWDADPAGHLPQWQFGIPVGRSADLAWIQVAIWHLAPNGRGFVVLPMGALFRGGQEARTRAELLRQGCVEAVVALPAGLAGATPIPLSLWVLARPGEAAMTSEVLLLDSSTGELDSGAIAAAIEQWRGGHRLTDVLPAAAVGVVDLLADDANLTPQRWVVREDQANAPELPEIRAELDGLREAFRRLTAAATPGADGFGTGEGQARFVKVGEISASQLKVFRGRSKAGTGEDGARLLTAAHVRHPERDRPTAPAEEGEVKASFVTEPGDVLVVTEGVGIAAIVDREGGHAVAAPVQIIRLRDSWVTPEYLTEVLKSGRNRRFLSGTTIPRAAIKDLEIPVLAPEQQREVVQRVRMLRDCAGDARDVAERADSVADAIFAAASLGTVTVEPSRGSTRTTTGAGTLWH